MNAPNRTSFLLLGRSLMLEALFLSVLLLGDRTFGSGFGNAAMGFLAVLGIGAYAIAKGMPEPFPAHCHGCSALVDENNDELWELTAGGKLWVALCADCRRKRDAERYSSPIAYTMHLIHLAAAALAEHTAKPEVGFASWIMRTGDLMDELEQLRTTQPLPTLPVIGVDGASDVVEERDGWSIDLPRIRAKFWGGAKDHAWGLCWNCEVQTDYGLGVWMNVEVLKWFVSLRWEPWMRAEAEL